ncbi:MAG TPA: DUF1800 domain-containing protein [Luteimonas sp.]|nr:DUF1800 domain-containing protein [Luteimonas sp.]HRP72519.1 DUF1800 domain-containing protein [Luteimonas sp.]
MGTLLAALSRWSPWPTLLALLVLAPVLRRDAAPVPAQAPVESVGMSTPTRAVASAAPTPVPRATGGPGYRRLAQPSPADAARFLTQATFGPTLADIERVRQLGYRAWIDEQVAHPVSLQLRFMQAASSYPRRERRLDAWLTHTLGGPDPFDPALIHRDQLRQRVAFALSEILVVSDGASDKLGNAPLGMTDYYDTLARGAFGNYRELLENVTLHPAMGIFLSMLGNEKPDPVNNIRPDENYAREVLQLFSIGTVRLNPDGTRMLDGSGRPIPTYTQDTVKGFAHVFTGWSFDLCEYGFHCYAFAHDHPAWSRPMKGFPAFHASAQSKQLLVYPGVALPGGVLPAGGTPQSDLRAALDNIFGHPNVGPHIARLLIQRLVTSNPGPAYIQRVAQAFDNNGQGVRGDMMAVVTAILLDPEARQSNPPPHFGKVREPVVRLMHLLRAMDAASGSGRSEEFWTLGMYLGQMPLDAPSVFNFFSPDYMPPGPLTEAGLVAPELQLATDAMLPSHEGYFYRRVVSWSIEGPPGSGTYSVNIARDLPLAADAAALVDRYDLLFLSGRMSPGMRQVLLERLQDIPGNTLAGRRQRVKDVLYLITNAPEYVVQK